MSLLQTFPPQCLWNEIILCSDLKTRLQLQQTCRYFRKLMRYHIQQKWHFVCPVVPTVWSEAMQRYRELNPKDRFSRSSLCAKMSHDSIFAEMSPTCCFRPDKLLPLAFFDVCFVIGKAGCGKTTFVREWINQKRGYTFGFSGKIEAVTPSEAKEPKLLDLMTWVYMPPPGPTPMLMICFADHSDDIPLHFLEQATKIHVFSGTHFGIPFALKPYEAITFECCSLLARAKRVQKEHVVVARKNKKQDVILQL